MQYIFFSIYRITIYSNNFSLFVYGATLEFYGKYTICMYIYAGLFFPELQYINVSFTFLVRKNRTLHCLDKRNDEFIISFV